MLLPYVCMGVCDCMFDREVVCVCECVFDRVCVFVAFCVLSFLQSLVSLLLSTEADRNMTQKTLSDFRL